MEILSTPCGAAWCGSANQGPSTKVKSACKSILVQIDPRRYRGQLANRGTQTTLWDFLPLPEEGLERFGRHGGIDQVLLLRTSRAG